MTKSILTRAVQCCIRKLLHRRFLKFARLLYLTLFWETIVFENSIVRRNSMGVLWNSHCRNKFPCCLFEGLHTFRTFTSKTAGYRQTAVQRWIEVWHEECCNSLCLEIVIVSQHCSAIMYFSIANKQRTNKHPARGLPKWLHPYQNQTYFLFDTSRRVAACVNSVWGAAVCNEICRAYRRPYSTALITKQCEQHHNQIKMKSAVWK